jgi:putative hemolysin
MAQGEVAMIGSLNSRRGAAVVLMFLAGFLAACGVPTQADQPGRAQIDAVTVQILESFPVQVEVLVRGNLPDDCTEVGRVDQRFDPDENIFWIEIATVRTTEDVCAQALVPFEKTVALDVYGLPAGTYTVDVNGTRETFTLEVDNAPPEAGLPNPASVYCEEQGYLLKIRTDEQGNQHGVCMFPDGSECDEWAFFRGECAPAD